MHVPSSFDYAVVRIVPRVQREEFFNAGVILFCPQLRFLKAMVHLDTEKLNAMAPQMDIADVQHRLAAIPKVAEADENAGPIARLSQRARFHWLVSPRSALVQISPVHCGICVDPDQTLERLFNEQVGISGWREASRTL